MRFYNERDLLTAIQKQEAKLGKFHYAMKYYPKGSCIVTGHEYTHYPSQETLDRAYQRLRHLYKLEQTFPFEYSFKDEFDKLIEEGYESYKTFVTKDNADILKIICEKKNILYGEYERTYDDTDDTVYIQILLNPDQIKVLTNLINFKDIEPEYSLFSRWKDEPIEDMDEPKDTFECRF